jgi:hypothetical protein
VRNKLIGQFSEAKIALYSLSQQYKRDYALKIEIHQKTVKFNKITVDFSNA